MRLTASLIVYETGPLDWWAGMIPLNNFAAGEFADPHAEDTWAPQNTPEGFSKYINDLLEEAKSLAADVLFYEGDVREGPFLSVLPDPANQRTLPILAWKQDNNGMTYIATLMPLPYLDSDDSVRSAHYRDGATPALRSGD